MTVEGTRQSDRECAPCAPGTRPISVNAAYCEFIVTCTEGTYLTGVGTENPECVSCPSGTFNIRTNATSCRAWSSCPAGQYVAASGTAASDVTCAYCPSGFFRAANASADACSAWTDCVASQYVSVPGTRSADRVCEVCLPDTYTNGPNQAVCVGVDACPPGTVQAAPATPSSAAVCSACTVGQYCAGDTTPAVPCSGGTWDHDADPATTCVARTSCAAGTYVSNEGNATHDRVCTPCSSGAYSSATNASACTPWTFCGAGTHVDVPGTPTSNRTCADCPAGTYTSDPNLAMCTEWQVCGFAYLESAPGTAVSDRTCVLAITTRQFGTSEDDAALAVSAGDLGYVIGGRTNGTLPQQTALGGTDAFVQLYSRGGVLAWTRQFGTASDDAVTSVSRGPGGSVFATGYTGSTSSGGASHLLRRYAPSGDLYWTQNLPWIPASVSAGSYSTCVVAGSVSLALPGQTHFGSLDAVVQKYDGAGNVLWTRQFGGVGEDLAVAVSVGSDGSVVLAGRTYEGLPGQTHLGDYDVFVRKYDEDGALLWTRQFGTPTFDYTTAVSVGVGGTVAVAGHTIGTLPGQTSVGVADAFVRTYDADGTLLWTRQFGGSAHDLAYAVSVAADGRVHVAGQTEGGALPNQVHYGLADAFLVTYDAAGSLVRIRQFGTSASDQALAMSSDNHRSTFVVGAVGDALPGQVHLGGTDAFCREFVDP